MVQAVTVTGSVEVDDDAVVGLLAARTRGLDRGRYVRLVRERGAPGRLLREGAGAELGAPLEAVVRSVDERRRCQADLVRWERDGIRCVALGGMGYPQTLEHIPDPPLVLFVAGGDAGAAFAKPGLAVVGSRRADALGCALASEVGEQLARAGACIVSGLALGIDGAAHRGALASQVLASTIAVFGSGLYTVYPAMHRPLAHDIRAAGGLLVSQFEPETRPLPANFLNRNRVIAGLARAVLIVEAAERSGALATARYALESGRELMVVPGSIRDPLFTGSNRLFRSGAVPILGVEDVFEYFPGGVLKPGGEGPQKSEQSSPQGGEAGGGDGAGPDRLLATLDPTGPIHVDELAARHPSGGDFYSDLFALELRGAIVRLPGNYVQRIR